MRLLRWIDSKFSTVENYLLVLLLTSIIFFSFLRVVLRNFFDTGIRGVDEFLGHLVLIVAFVGAAQATRLQKHIKIDALSKILSDSSKNLAAIFINLFALVITLILAYAAGEHVMFEREIDDTIFGVNKWIYQLAMPLGLFLIAYRFFLQFVEEILSSLKGNP